MQNKSRFFIRKIEKFAAEKRLIEYEMRELNKIKGNERRRQASERIDDEVITYPSVNDPSSSYVRHNREDRYTRDNRYSRGNVVNSGVGRLRKNSEVSGTSFVDSRGFIGSRSDIDFEYNNDNEIMNGMENEYETHDRYDRRVTGRDRYSRDHVGREREFSLQRSEQRRFVNLRGSSRQRRAPTSAAVTIRGADDGVFSYADNLKKAREKIDLAALGINKTIIRRGNSGGLVIRVAGEDHNRKADLLAGRLREIFEQNLRVGRPVKRGELLILGLDDSVQKEEILRALSMEGECMEQDIKLGEIKIFRDGQG